MNLWLKNFARRNASNFSTKLYFSTFRYFQPPRRARVQNKMVDIENKVAVKVTGQHSDLPRTSGAHTHTHTKYHYMYKKNCVLK